MKIIGYILLLILPLKAFGQEDTSHNKNADLLQDTLQLADSLSRTDSIFQTTDSILHLSDSILHLSDSAGTSDTARTVDSTSRADTSAGDTTAFRKRILSEALIPEEEDIDTVVVLPLEITTSCYNFKSRLEWSFNPSDSLFSPHRLYLHLKPFLQGEFAGDTLKLLDSTSLKNRNIWVSHPGIYFLSFFDTTSRRLYKSSEVSVHICTAYELPDKFNLGQDKVLKPKQNYNIEKIDLIIFSTHGEEVFTTTNPAIEWDGRNKNTGLRCEPGNYFFTCDVYERKGNVTEKRNITGVIEIVQ